MHEINYSLNCRTDDSYLDRMNFLNEISILHDEAISFASGRPNSKYFNVNDVVSKFIEYNTQLKVHGNDQANEIGQYNKTKGIINNDIAKLLANDLNIVCQAEDIIVTDGAQEGMVLLINALFNSASDVLIVSDPTYIGFVGYAKICGINIVSVPREMDSVDLKLLEQTVKMLIQQGSNPKCFYEVPNYHNPTGEKMPQKKCLDLIDLAEKYNFLIIEDDPYGYFNYENRELYTLKSLDKYNRVIYLGSFSKTIFPSIRIGFILADQKISCNEHSLNLIDVFYPLIVRIEQRCNFCQGK